MSTKATQQQLKNILKAIDACVVSVVDTGCDVTAERCAKAALDLTHVYRLLSETET